MKNFSVLFIALENYLTNKDPLALFTEKEVKSVFSYYPAFEKSKQSYFLSRIGK